MTDDPTTAMVLAAGLGTRLLPATRTTPKPLLDLGGRPMIEYPIRLLAAHGVRRIVVNLHHLAERIPAALGSGERFGVELLYSEEDPILDTGGGIARARPLLDRGPFFVVNGDVLADVDLRGVFRFHRERRALATLVVREDPEAERYGAFDLDETGRIRRFLGEPRRSDVPLRRHMFTGIHCLSPEMFDRMPPKERFSITRDVYAELFRSGAPLWGYVHDGYWRDLGTVQSLEAARRDLAAGTFRPSFLG